MRIRGLSIASAVALVGTACIPACSSSDGFVGWHCRIGIGTASPATVRIGQSTTLSSTDPGDCPDHARSLELTLVDATWHTFDLGTVQFDRDGRLDHQVTIPSGAAKGHARLGVDVPPCDDTGSSSCAGFGADLTIS